jgi:hypothetical protein
MIFPDKKLPVGGPSRIYGRPLAAKICQKSQAQGLKKSSHFALTLR